MPRKTLRAIYRLWHSMSAAGRVGYIGKTKYFPERTSFEQRRKDPGCKHLYAALRKYPISAWRLEVLALGLRSDASLCKAEIFYIKKFQSKTKGYNCTDGGEGLSGFHHSEETKRKISELKKGTNRGKENHFYGRTHSVETLKKQASVKKGRKYSIEHRQAISAGLFRAYQERRRSRKQQSLGMKKAYEEGRR